MLTLNDSHTGHMNNQTSDVGLKLSKCHSPYVNKFLNGDFILKFHEGKQMKCLSIPLTGSAVRVCVCAGVREQS